MSGGHSARASWGAADAAALCWRSSLLGSRFGCDQKLWHRSPGRTAAREQPRALHCSHCLFRISISARPGRPMSWRLVEPDCAPPLGPPAAGPRRRPAALRRLQAARWRARRRARPPHARSLKTPSAAVPGTAHDLLFSFTKKAKLRGGGRGGKEKGKKKRKNIAPRNGCCDRDRPQRRAVGGEGSEWGLDTRRPRLGHAPKPGHAPPLLCCSLRPLPSPLGATNGGQKLTWPASKTCWILTTVFPRRLGRNSAWCALGMRVRGPREDFPVSP